MAVRRYTGSCGDTLPHLTDHSKAIADFERIGIEVWKPYLDEKKIQSRKFGIFKCRSFDVPHDDTPCVGYIIEMPNGEKLLYATDFQYIKYSFKKLRIQHMLIECNHMKDLIDREAAKFQHSVRGHAELEVTKGIVADNADSLKTVILCHMSHDGMDLEVMLAEMQKVAPQAYVDYAEKGKEWELSAFPF